MSTKCKDLSEDISDIIKYYGNRLTNVEKKKRETGGTGVTSKERTPKIAQENRSVVIEKTFRETEHLSSYVSHDVTPYPLSTPSPHPVTFWDCLSTTNTPTVSARLYLKDERMP